MMHLTRTGVHGSIVLDGLIPGSSVGAHWPLRSIRNALQRTGSLTGYDVEVFRETTDGLGSGRS